jgi:hypothetical protein
MSKLSLIKNIIMKQLFFKRFFATILMLAVCSLSWAFDFESNGIYYLINKDGTSVSVSNRGLSGSYSSSVVIPSTVQYSGKQYSVTSIGAGAFSGCADLTSVNIPNSVTNIGAGAFSRCTGLASITIPNSVASIGAYVFSGCTSLNSIVSIVVDEANPYYVLLCRNIARNYKQ